MGADDVRRRPPRYCICAALGRWDPQQYRTEALTSAPAEDLVQV